MGFFEDRVLRKIFWLRKQEEMGRKNYIIRSFIIFTMYYILLG